MLYYVALTVSYLFGLSGGARILGVVPTPSISHQSVFRPLWRELVKRGHEVVLLTTDPMVDPPPNLTQIDLHFVYAKRDEWNFLELVKENENNPYRLGAIIRDIFLKTYEEEVNHRDVKGLIEDDDQTFDLVLNEMMHAPMFGLAYRFRCPYIGLTTAKMPELIHSYIGSPIHPVAYPDVILPFSTDEMSFWKRVASTLFYLASHMKLYISGLEEEQIFMEKYFGRGVPETTEMWSDVSMIFVNTHPVLSNRPLGPNVISIGGGFHLEPPKPLPKDLRDILNSAKQAIYISFGTNVLSDQVPQVVQEAFIDVFNEFPTYKFLWKFDKKISGLPKNVIRSDWFPQRDLLNHSSVKAFVTQGGLQSIEEAIFTGVPMVFVPFLYDQISNAHASAKNGLGVVIDPHDLTKESLRDAIIQVVEDSKYKECVENMKELLIDLPMSGLDQAVWWTEYVLRHKGVEHFRSKMLDLPFYQVYLLDVVGFLFFVPLVILYLSSKLLSKCLFKK